MRGGDGAAALRSPRAARQIIDAAGTGRAGQLRPCPVPEPSPRIACAGPAQTSNDRRGVGPRSSHRWAVRRLRAGRRRSSRPTWRPWAVRAIAKPPAAGRAGQLRPCPASEPSAPHHTLRPPPRPRTIAAGGASVLSSVGRPMITCGAATEQPPYVVPIGVPTERSGRRTVAGTRGASSPRRAASKVRAGRRRSSRPTGCARIGGPLRKYVRGGDGAAAPLRGVRASVGRFESTCGAATEQPPYGVCVHRSAARRLSAGRRRSSRPTGRVGRRRNRPVPRPPRYSPRPPIRVVRLRLRGSTPLRGSMNSPATLNASRPAPTFG